MVRVETNLHVRKVMTLAIMSALPQEAATLHALMRDVREHEIAGRVFYSGELAGAPVVLVYAHVGKVAAALSATTLLHRFDVEKVLFFGVAGGVGDGVGIGDVVIADGLFFHDLDARPIFERFEVPNLSRSIVPVDMALADQIARASADFAKAYAAQFDDALRARIKIEQPKIHRGLVATGDKFVYGAEAGRAIAALKTRTVAVEMEGAAVAQVCYEFGVPCAVVRTISDAADTAAPAEFDVFLNEAAGKYTAGILQAYLAT